MQQITCEGLKDTSHNNPEPREKGRERVGEGIRNPGKNKNDESGEKSGEDEKNVVQSFVPFFLSRKR